MKRAALASLEAALTLGIALVLSLLFVWTGALAWRTLVEGKPLARTESAGERRDVEFPLARRSGDAVDPDALARAVGALGLARSVDVEGPDDARVLVVEGVPADELPAVRRAIERQGYRSTGFTIRPAGPDLAWAPPGGGTPGPAMIVLAVTLQAVAFGALGLLMVRWRVRPEDPVRRRSPAYAVLVGLGFAGVAVVGTIVISAVLHALGFEVREQDWVVRIARDNPAALWALAPWTVVLGPVAEEVFFRGYLFRFLGQRAGWTFGYVASASAFALIHLHPPALPLYLFYGFLLAAAYRRTSRLTAAVVAHMAINLIGTLVLYLTAGEMTV